MLGALYTGAMSEERSPIIAWLSKFVVFAVAAFVLYQLQNIAALAFIGVIVASAVRPAVRFGKKFYIPAAVSIMVTYAVLFTVISVLLSLVIPPLANESAALVQRASSTFGLEDMRIVERISLDVTQLGEVAQNFDQYNGVLTQLTGSVQVVLGLLISTFSLLFVLFSLLVIAFHMLSDIDRMSLSFAWMLPRRTREEQAKLAVKIMDSVTHQLGSWVRGQVLLMFVIGTGTYIGLVALGIPYALPLALLAGFLEFIPNLGPTIAAIPAVLVAFLMVNPLVGCLTVAFYLLIQQIENNFIVPGIMKNAVDVQPLTTILLLLIGFELKGVLGAILSVPLYVAIRCVVRFLWPDEGPFADYTEYLPKFTRKAKSAEKSDK
jgi:predicted PurR-regulated permease PerM